MHEIPIIFGLLRLDYSILVLLFLDYYEDLRNQRVLDLMQMETLQELPLILKNYHLARKFIAHVKREEIYHHHMTALSLMMMAITMVLKVLVIDNDIVLTKPTYEFHLEVHHLGHQHHHQVDQLVLHQVQNQ